MTTPDAKDRDGFYMEETKRDPDYKHHLWYYTTEQSWRDGCYRPVCGQDRRRTSEGSLVWMPMGDVRHYLHNREVVCLRCARYAGLLGET